MHVVKVPASTPTSAPATPSAALSSSAGALPVIGTRPLLTAPVSPLLMQMFDNAMSMLLLNSEEIVLNAVGLLLKVLNNIVAHPMEEKYRKIKTTNAAFSSKVQSIPGGAECMRAAGFTEVNGEWVLFPSAQGWDLLVACKSKLELFLGKLEKLQKGGTSPTVTSAVVATPAPAAPVADPNALIALLAALQTSASENDNGSGP